MPAPPRRPRVIAIASAGGHWIQLLRLRSAFAACDVTWVTTNAELATGIDGKVEVVSDASAKNPLRVLLSLWQVCSLLVRVRPRFIVSTGAAPGALAIVIGRVFGARTLWLDSIANVDELSRSGRIVRRFASAWLTQWEHLVAPKGPEFWGKVL
jgi:UDP-N-acetylglucosamine:LPS N-acetylglucosamine transferase